MAMSIKKSLLKQNKKTDEERPGTSEDSEAEISAPPAFSKTSGGAGSAWKAGALAQTQADLDLSRETLAADILAGNHVIELNPEMISDPIGTDRRNDWQEQEEFLSLVDSIRENGQDMPILVWPVEPKWQPDNLDPKNLERVQFFLLAGRRRCEAARKLGLPVRAVIASQEGRGSTEDTFKMLVLRFRENEEREDLSAFERLLSIGQMYEELSSSSSKKIKAKDLANRIGVHESIVSRARAVHKVKDEILNTFKNAYDLSFRELQNALTQMSEQPIKTAKATTKPTKLKVVRKIGKRNLSVETVDGKLSVKTTGVKLDKKRLEGLSDLIANYLNSDDVSD